MNKKSNWQEYKQVLDEGKVCKLYHFTDRDNLDSIIKNGGLYSWADCEEKGISIAKPGGSGMSRSLDKRDGLEHYVRLSFVRDYPMMFVAMDEGRISNPVVLEIDIETALWENTLYADMNTTKNGAHVGGTLDDLKAVHFELFDGLRYFDMSDDDKIYYKAEVLIKNFIPLKYITNIGNFGMSIPHFPNQIVSKVPYTAQITRNTPTAFIFLVDQSLSMGRKTYYDGQIMSMAEAVAKIVNNQINELVLRCVKYTEIRNYYDIAVIGYGEDAYSGWKGELEGRYFVSPEELIRHPYKKIIMKEEVRTRKGTSVEEFEVTQWIEPRCDGSWTHLHKALSIVNDLLCDWMIDHHEKDCYPPTIINITDGEINHIKKEELLQMTNELKSMFTNDGNVLLWNIHITSKNLEQVLFPVDKQELKGEKYSEMLYEMSSLLPLRYNEQISKLRGDTGNVRHVAMSINADMSSLIQIMDIGTPTNISKNQ